MHNQKFSGNLAKHLYENVKKMPDSIAVILQSENTFSKTFTQLLDDVVCCASLFQKRGVQKRDRSLLMVKPGYELIVCCFALLYLGAIPIIIDPGMGFRSILNCIKISKPKNLICIPLVSWFSRLFRTTFSTVGLTLTIRKDFTKKLKVHSSFTKPKIWVTKEKDLAAIVFTSGSTGMPKGVRYLNGNFNAQVQALKDQFGIKSGEIDLVTLPIFSLFNPALGVTSVIPNLNPRKPAMANPEILVDAILKHNTTTAFCSPVIGKKILAHCQKFDISLPKMLRVMLAGAPSPPSLITNLAKCLPNGKVLIPYGATEALPVSFSDHNQTKKLSSSILKGEGSNLGKPIDGVSILIMPIKNSPFPNEHEGQLNPIENDVETGEICVAGNIVTGGYDQMPGVTRDSRFIYNSKEYHRMGDLGYWDEEGNLRFLGRKAERIKTINGHIETERCEPLVNAIRGIKRCALIGIGSGEIKEPSLVVEASFFCITSKNELLQKVQSTLAKNIPNYGIRRIFFEKKLPVDKRHNAKIHRLTLSQKWTRKVGKAEKLGLIR